MIVKKILFGVLCFVLCPVISASATTLYENEDSADIDVYGVFSEDDTKSNYWEEEFIDGIAEIEVEDDTVITVSIDDYEGDIRLIVGSINENCDDIYIWFIDLFSDEYEEIYPYDIFFVNENYERIETGLDFTVTLTDNSKLINQEIYFVSDNGKKTIMDCTYTENCSTFTSNVTGYYVVAYKQVDSQSVDDGDAPQTGDMTNLNIFYVIMITCLLAIAILIVMKRKGDKSKEFTNL